MKQKATVNFVPSYTVTPSVCPHCGHCPTCGRSNTPYMPVPYTIWGSGGSTGFTTSSGSTSGAIDANALKKS